MKSYIELYSVYFLSTAGITLTMENPRIEKTEETFEKLKYYIDEGYLRVIEVEDNTEFEEAQPEETVYIPDEAVKMEEVPMVKRFKTYTEEDLKGMKKDELLAVCEELEIEVKANTKVAELTKLILDFSKE